MKITDGPKETIISIARENWIWRWLTVLLGLGIMVSSFLSYYLSRKPSTVWMVTEDGKITNSDQMFFYWEPREAARRAVEIFYMPSPQREKLLGQYFVDSLALAGIHFKARDRFVSYRIDDVGEKGSEIFVRGILFRENERDEHLSLTLTRKERSEENPFGLIVSSCSTQQKLGSE